MKGIGVTDEKGGRKEYRVKPFEDMTVGDWVQIASPPIPESVEDEYERLLVLLCRHTTIPRKVMDRMPARNVRLLADALVTVLEQVTKEREEAIASTPGKSFKFKGVEYLIPHNIEVELSFGQHQSLTKVLLPACETEADMYASILAVCCLPEGEEFDGARVKERQALFMGLPLKTALAVCAFFFDCSEMLRTSINHTRLRCRGLYRLKLEQMLKPMQSSTVA